MKLESTPLGPAVFGFRHLSERPSFFWKPQNMKETSAEASRVHSLSGGRIRLDEGNSSHCILEVRLVPPVFLGLAHVRLGHVSGVPVFCCCSRGAIKSLGVPGVLPGPPPVSCSSWKEVRIVFTGIPRGCHHVFGAEPEVCGRTTVMMVMMMITNQPVL